MRMEWKRSFRPTFAFAALAAAALSAACAPPSISIGVPIGLTGPASGIGYHGRNGIELAAAEINAAGGIAGRMIDLRITDDLETPEGGLAAARTLAEGGADVIIGFMSSGAASLAIDYLSERRIVVLSPTASSVDFSARDDYFFRLIGSNDNQGRLLAEEAVARGYRRAAMVYNRTNRSYTASVLDGFAAEFERGGGQTVMLSPVAEAATNDYGAVAQEYAASGADCLVVAASSFDAGSIAQELALRGSKAPLFAAMWARTPDLFVYGGATVDGAVLVGAADAASEDASPELRRFAEAYRARFGEGPLFSAVFAYEAMRALEAGLRATRGAGGPALKRALLELEAQPGLQGAIKFDAFGDVTRPYFLFEARDGRFIRLR